jgi:hypothetical protein
MKTKTKNKTDKKITQKTEKWATRILKNIEMGMNRQVRDDDRIIFVTMTST